MFISHQSHTVVLTHYALKLWLQLVTFISHKFLHSIICIHFVLKSWIESECPITNVYFTPIVHNHTHAIEIMISMSSIYFTQTVAYNCTHNLHWNRDLKVRVWCVQYSSVHWVSENMKTFVTALVAWTAGPVSLTYKLQLRGHGTILIACDFCIKQTKQTTTEFMMDQWGVASRHHLS